MVLILTTFLFGFAARGAVFTYESKLAVSVSVGLTSLVLILVSLVGVVITGWVLLLFFKDFRWSKLDETTTTSSEPDKAPLALEVSREGHKGRFYLLDSRNSPRLTNPKLLGRGVFIIGRKRSKYGENDAVALVSDGKLQINNLRSYDKKIYFDLIDKDETIVLEVVNNQPMTINFINPTPTVKIVENNQAIEELTTQWVKSIKS